MNLVSIPSLIVEDPPHVLFWEMDEVIPSITLFVVLYMWDFTVAAFLLPAAFTILYGKIKSSTMRGFLFHSVWWFGVFEMNKKFKSAFERVIFE